MSIIKLGIRNFRNLHSVDIEPAADINLIVGNNASGKTSLLEAIYFLGMASSFRTTHFDRILENGESELSVYAKQILKTGQIIPFGIQKGVKKVIFRINEQKIDKVSDLVSNLPLQVIHPNSHHILEQGPRNRRKFIDWGVFHVEQNFFLNWKRYQRALKQRNACLRNRDNKAIIQAWDNELIESGINITCMRKQYLIDLEQLLPQYIAPMLGDIKITLNYQQGWKKDFDFDVALKNAINLDIDRGFTTVGPQRADITIKADDMIANERISRGQQKILVTGLLLAQTALFNHKTNNNCLLLIDDVAAELDPKNKECLLSILANMKMQLFLTSIERSTLESVLDQSSASKMFHVEHGFVSEVV